MQKNLTSGSVFKNLIFFSLPFFLSYFLQTLYGMADLYIIGKFGGVADITAVSIGSQVMHMLTVMIVGLAMGATVTVSQFIGAGKKREASNSVGNTVTLFMAVSVVLTLLLVCLVSPITRVMATPEEAVSGTKAYLTVCFIGIPFITAYNIISAVFRGIGDSKSPMYFIAAACLANILLDVLFMGAFNMGPVGAALGTTLSQAISVVISFVFIRKKDIGISVKASDLKPNRQLMSRILRIGIPVALQDGFIQISFVVITIIANTRGLNDAAAVGIVEKIIGILFLVPSSMLSSVSALAAQNIGANRQDRARQTLMYAICIVVGFGMVIAGILQFYSAQAVGIFEDDAAVMRLGSQYLKSYVLDCMFAGVHFCFSGYFCAVGKSGISFIHNVLSILLVRIPGSYLASVNFPDTLYPMGLAAPMGSLLSIIICVIAYIWLLKKQKNDVKLA